MYDFIRANIILILALSGAIISFLSVLTQKVAQRNKLKISIILAAFMFLIVSGQQIIGYIEKKNENLQKAAAKASRDFLQEKRDEIIDKIEKTVTKTKTLTEQINEKLQGKSPEKIGVQVIQEAETDKILPIPKRSIGWWPNYVKWLENLRGKKGISPCLSLTFNAGHNYNLNLLLLYILTNPQTIPYIDNLQPPDHFKFPTEEFLRRFQIPVPEIKYVLFFDDKSNLLLGYAHAGLFSKELLVYLKTGEQRTIENILNKIDVDFNMKMQKYFNSYNKNVLREKDAYMVAKEMIEKQYNETAVIYKDKLYIAKLTNIVDLVRQ